MGIYLGMGYNQQLGEPAILGNDMALWNVDQQSEYNSVCLKIYKNVAAILVDDHHSPSMVVYVCRRPIRQSSI
jgi:hypothetical protein